MESLNTWLQEDCRTPEDAANKYAFVTRYIFSCLTDADSLDTEAFNQGAGREPLTADFRACLDRVNKKLHGKTVAPRMGRAS